jgi:hypothetical protein
MSTAVAMLDTNEMGLWVAPGATILLNQLTLVSIPSPRWAGTPASNLGVSVSQGTRDESVISAFNFKMF